MNPALMNYLQNMQMSNQGQNLNQPQGSGQTNGMPQPQQQINNPFDSGIQKAIASARMSLGMTQQQEDRALRESMLAFGDNMAQQPREKGFLNNFASVGKALSPAIQAHDQSEEAALTQNNALANQILAYQAAEQQRGAQAEERAWHRQHAENQLGEQSRYHDMINSRMSPGSYQNSQQEEQTDPVKSEMSNILNNAEKILTDDLKGQETYRGRMSNIISRFTPGGYIPSEKQAEINTYGDIIKGKLFNLFKYRNRAEFEHLPTISADNPPEVNLERIKTLKKLLGGASPQMQGQEIASQTHGAYTADESSVPLYNPETNMETEAHPDDVAALEAEGWERI